MADELNKPSRGTGDWDIPLNQNFDTLEAAARAFLPRGTTQTLNVSDVNSDSITNSGTVDTQRLSTEVIDPLGSFLIQSTQFNNLTGTTVIDSDFDTAQLFVFINSNVSAFGGIDEIKYKSNGNSVSTLDDLRGSNTRSYSVNSNGELEFTTSEDVDLDVFSLGIEQ
jgi:hypothetical protein